ncbi:MAG TPA: hypothetical protein VLZ28_05765, partial [Daejeonella sp.]|nr:hypothetical protein [Daejeonella sp.]
MQHWYEWQGCELIYLPLHQLGNVHWNSIQEYLTYQFPVLNKPEFKEVLGTLQEPAHMLVNRLLIQTNLQSSDGKAFLVYTNDALSHSDIPFIILASYGVGSSVVEFFQSGFQKLWELQQPAFLADEIQFYEAQQQYEEQDSAEVFRPNYNLSIQQHHIQIVVPEQDEPIPILSQEVTAHLEGLKQIGDKELMLDVVVHLLNNLNPYLKADKQAILKMIERYWSEYAVTPYPSRLLIDKHSKLFLTDFGNLEIKMSPLPKTLFLFYLRHPEGVAF